MTQFRNITLSDGYALTYRVSLPSEGPHATLVLFNGIMSHSGWFAPLHPALERAGIKVVGADRRGSGQNRIGWGDAPSAGRLIEDALAIVAAEREPDRPLVVLGWCWGAVLAIHLADKLGTALDGLILVTPGLFNQPAMRDAVARVQPIIDAAPVDAAVVPSPVDERWFTDGEALDGFIRKDEHRVTHLTPRLLDITAKLVAMATPRLRRLELPMLLLLAEHDEATDNAATLAAFAKLPAERWNTVTLPARHGVQFDAPDLTAEHIATFVRRFAL